MATKTNNLSLPWLLIALSLLQGTLAVRFGATNNASATPGGQRFDREIGISYTLKTMPEIANFIWKLFRQPSDADRRHYYPDDVVNVIIQDLQDSNLAETGENNVYMGAKGIETYPPADGTRFRFTSILYHEMTHIFQWSGKGTAPGGLTEGMADYSVLKSPFYVEGYSKPGQGIRWDEGYGTTSRFLEYCDSLRDGFTPELNRMMRVVYMPEYWNLLLGKDVDQVWEEYKRTHNREQLIFSPSQICSGQVRNLSLSPSSAHPRPSSAHPQPILSLSHCLYIILIVGVYQILPPFHGS